MAAQRIYTDHGFTGTTRARPGLDQALAALRDGDTLVVPKLDRLARSVPDACAIAESLATRGIRLQLGSTVHDPTDPMGKLFFNILATFAEFEADLIQMRTREEMAVPAPRASCGARSRSCRTASNRNCAGCMTPATTRSVIWDRCSGCRGRPSIAPWRGRRWRDAR